MIKQMSKFGDQTGSKELNEMVIDLSNIAAKKNKEAQKEINSLVRD